MAPKWLQNGANLAAKWALEASWRPLGGLLKPLKRLGRPRVGFQGLNYGALLSSSWVALGAEKRNLERLLVAPREIPRQVSAILGGPKGSQKDANRFQNRVQEAM